jgi:capsular exopolysaccharide synthesis family protein
MLMYSSVHVPSDERLVAFLRPHSFEAEQFRRLRQRLEEFAAQRGTRVIALTSAVASDGKTLVAINLAGALSGGRSSRILLIDADLRCPAVASTLAIDPGGRDLLHALDSPLTELDRAVHHLDGGSLDVLPCGRSRADAYEILTSPAFAALIAEARRRYDFVVVDTPPVVPLPDTALLRPTIDGYLVVVSAHTTPRKLVAETLSQLDPPAVLGLVFNRDDQPLFGYYRSSYSRYFRDYTRALEAEP